MFDDVGRPLNQAPDFIPANSDLNATGSNYATWSAAITANYQRTHTLLTSIYGSNPRWWDGAKVYAPPKAEFASTDVAMNWILNEMYDLQSWTLLNMTTTDQPLFCTDIRWCPAGLPSTPNSNGTIELWMTRDSQVIGIND